jgi:heat shock protein HspQ
MARFRTAKFAIGDVVRHRRHPFRGVVFEIDPTFSHSEEWWQAIPEDVRPAKDQPYYHLLAENADTTYVAYVSEQNLLSDARGGRCRHPDISQYFSGFEDGRYVPRPRPMN